MASSYELKSERYYFSDPQNQVRMEELWRLIDDLKSGVDNQERADKSIEAITQLSTFTDVIQEVPAGTTDGANVNFTITYSVYDPDSIVLMSNGRPQYNGIDFNAVGTDITFVAPPALNAVLYAVYKKANPVQLFATPYAEVPEGVVDGVNRTFLLSAPPKDTDEVIAMVSGNVLLQNVDFYLDGATAQFYTAPSTTVYVCYNFFSNSSPYTINFSEVPTGTIDGVNDTFTITYTPDNASSTLVFLNNSIQRNRVDYTITEKDVVFTSPPAALSTVFVIYVVRINAEILEQISAAGGSALPDGDYGDVVISGSGTVMEVQVQANPLFNYWNLT